MSVVGFEHAFAEAVEKELAPETVMKVAPLHVLALLKIVAYMDDPNGRSKDLEDLGRLMEQYELEGERRFARKFSKQAPILNRRALFYSVWMLAGCVRGASQDCGQPDRSAPGRQPASPAALGERTRRGISDRGKAKADRSVCCGFCHRTKAKPRSVKLRP